MRVYAVCSHPAGFRHIKQVVKWTCSKLRTVVIGRQVIFRVNTVDTAVVYIFTLGTTIKSWSIQ